MTDVLTSEEIDTLLELFRAEGGGLDPKEEKILRVAASPAFRDTGDSIDLLSLRGLSRPLREAAERAFTTIEGSLATTIARVLRFESSCECVTVERVRFHEWAGRSRSPMAVFVLDLAPLACRGLMVLSAGFLHGAVDRLLGGTARIGSESGRFSKVELSVADALIEPMLRQFGDALSTFGESSPRAEKVLADVQLARFVSDHEPVLAARYELASGPLSGELRFVLSSAEVERQATSEIEGTEARMRPGHMRPQLEGLVHEVPLDMRVLLGRARLTLGQLLRLHVGDVVRLDSRVGEPVEGTIQGCTKLRGWIGPRNGRMAFRMAGADMEEQDDGA